MCFVNQDISVQFNGLYNSPLNYLVSPEELIITYQDYANKIKFIKPEDCSDFSISVVLPIGDELDVLLYIVSLLNRVNIRAKIFCSTNLLARISNYSNEHLEYFDINDESVVIESNVVITYGLGVLYFINNEVPVLIIGPYGIGGWITPLNFSALHSNGFLGRVGGELWEPIPLGIFKDELFFIKNCKVLQSTITENKALSKHLSYTPHSLSSSYIQKRKDRFAALLDINKRWSLIPFIASNIFLIEDENRVFIRRKYLNDTIAIVDQSEVFFLKSISGINTFLQIFNDSAMLEFDFWEIIYSLIEKNIVLIK